MKNILMVIFLFVSFLSRGQNIADVSQRGTELIVRDAENKKISSKQIGSRYSLIGFSSNIIVLRCDNEIIVYDEKFIKISSKNIKPSWIVKNVVGNNIILKIDNELITYNKNWEKISSRHE
jgi:hypothetical protein